MKYKLTAIQVKNAPDGKIEDGGGLRLIKRGVSGKWVYRYSHLGKRREMGIGSLAEIGLADARKIRDTWANILATGKDPITERNTQREAEKADLNKLDPTFADIAVTVFEARKASLRGDGERGRWFSPLRLYVIPAIGKKRMSEIHQSDIKAALTPIWKDKHPTAQKAIQRTRIIFEQARLMGIKCDPFTVDAAQHMLGAYDHKTEHHIATPWQDIPALYSKLSDNTASALCLRWSILTLVRSAGCRGAMFSEIDGNVWTVSADRVKGRVGKVNDFRVPLSYEAAEIAYKASEYSDKYLFPSYRTGHITDQALTKKLRRMGETGTVHGFRTSFRTWVQDTDACSFEVAETVLGHTVGGKVERSYARSDLLERRRHVLESWATFVTSMDSNVVRIRG
jgi:integrase